MKPTNHQLLTLFAGVVLAVTGCSSISRGTDQISLQEKVLLHPNPTSYEFEASVGDVTNAIKKAFNVWQKGQRNKYHESMWTGSGDSKTKRALSDALQSSGMAFLLWKGDGDMLAKNLLTKTGNENDAYIYGDVRPVGESRVYFKAGQPLIYYADFHIHLAAAAPHKTRMEISTYGSRVITGLDESWSPHGPSLIFVEVPPTTIEQYQILLGIGQQLGVTNMPPLVTPGPDAPVKELTLPRER
jgi:hypothetical protein